MRSGRPRRRLEDRRRAANTSSELGEAREEIHEAEAGHGAAHEVVRQDGSQRRPRVGEVVALPERGPGQHDEQQADLEEERDVDQPADQDRYPRA